MAAIRTTAILMMMMIFPSGTVAARGASDIPAIATATAQDTHGMPFPQQHGALADAFPQLFYYNETMLAKKANGTYANGIWSTAIDETTMAVGLARDVDKGIYDAGAVLVFEDLEGDGTGWQFVTKLYGSDTAKYDSFGAAVAIWKTTLVVGAVHGHNPNVEDAGSVYVFQRNQNGDGMPWSQTQKLLAKDGAEFDGFGISVAIWNNTIVVGAIWDDNRNGFDAGSVYIFQNNNGDMGSTWTQRGKIIARGGRKYNHFGYSVAIWETTIVVGAPKINKVYIFEMDNNNNGSNHIWTQTASITTPDRAADDGFGSSVAIWNNTIVVGAPGNDNAKGTAAGAAYVYQNTDSGSTAAGNKNWTPVAKLLGSDAGNYSQVGSSVAIQENHIVLGSYNSTSGAAYIFHSNDGNKNWIQEDKIVVHGSTSASSHVAITENAIVVCPEYPGSVAVYEILKDASVTTE